MADSPDDPLQGKLIFTCMKCKHPLIVPAEVPFDATIDASYAVPPHLDSDFKKKEQEMLELLAESFVVLPASPVKANRNSAAPTRDQQITALSRVFEIASDKCQLDHPLCGSCCEAIDRELNHRIQEKESDLVTFRNAERLSEIAHPSKRETRSEEELAAEEALLEKELKATMQERLTLREEQVRLENEAKQLDEFERKFWEEYQDYQMRLDDINREQLAVQQQIEASSEQLERLKRTNVYDDAFHIYHDGHFGTINGFRLGRLPSDVVDWAEINAALGQVVLLLHTIARQCGYKFKQYILTPMGSFSKMAKITEPNTQYELFGSNDLNLGKIFWYRRFDTALTWLLACIKEFGDEAHAKDPKWNLKYPIHEDTIDKLSIKLQFNNDATWTKALKYMLTNLKCLLAWTSKHKDH